MSNRRGEKTRDRILESGISVLLQEGASNVSLRQVASAAGVTPMAIYRHFDDKQSLELALLERAFALFEDYLDDVGSSDRPSQKLLALAGRFFDFALERSSHFRFIFLSSVRPTGVGRGSEVRAISRPTFLLLQDALRDWAEELEFEVGDINVLTVDVLAFCVGQAALVLSGNLHYAESRRRRELRAAFERYLKTISKP